MPPSAPLAAAALVALLGAACAGDDPRGEPDTPPPAVSRVDTGDAGVLSGRVTIEGAVPANARINMTADPVCARAHAGGASAETFVSERGGLGNVFVYVKDGLSGYTFDPPSQAVVLDQHGCQFRPRVFGVRVGQHVEFVNRDSTVHDVRAAEGANPEFNFTQAVQGQRNTRYFSRPEVMVHITCDRHEWASAYAGVLDHPYFAVTPPDGTFELKGLPAGSYTVAAWHEKLGTRAQTVALGERENRTLAFAFTAPAAP